MTLDRAFLVLAVATCLSSLRGPAAYGQSDAERLEKLERAVELLQKRNAQLDDAADQLSRNR